MTFWRGRELKLGGLAVRRVMLALAAVLFGLVAHFCGGGSYVSCAPLTLAAALAVAATLLADRFAGYERRFGFGVVGMTGLGQAAMHLALTRSLVDHTTVEAGGGGLHCGIVIAHGVATGVLVMVLLATQRVLDVPLSLVRRVRTAILAGLMMKALPGWDDVEPRHTTVLGADLTQVWIDFVADVRPLRGPPVAAVTA